MYDIEAGFTTAQSERTKEVDEFFVQVDDVKRAIAAIKTKQREIQRMHEQSKTIVRKADMQQHRAEVQVRIPVCWHMISIASHRCLRRRHPSTGCLQALASSVAVAPVTCGSCN